MVFLNENVTVGEDNRSLSFFQDMTDLAFSHRCCGHVVSEQRTTQS